MAGALNIFYAELKAGLPFSPHVTAFLSQGFMPTFIFGLPAVAYAIYRTARPENRPVIKGLLLSGVLVSVVTGISEPIEFLFLFIAPVLYAFHIVMSGGADGDGAPRRHYRQHRRRHSGSADLRRHAGDGDQMVSAVPGGYCPVCYLLLRLPLVHPQARY